MEMQERIRKQPSRWSRTRRVLLASLVASLLLGGSTPALADDYDSTEAGHPVRIAAYVLHPIGVLIDYLLLRPAHWIVSHEPLRTVFGHEGDESRED